MALVGIVTLARITCVPTDNEYSDPRYERAGARNYRLQIAGRDSAARAPSRSDFSGEITRVRRPDIDRERHTCIRAISVNK